MWEQCKFQETKFVISYAKEFWVSLTSLFEKDTKEKYVLFLHAVVCSEFISYMNMKYTKYLYHVSSCKCKNIFCNVTFQRRWHFPQKKRIFVITTKKYNFKRFHTRIFYVTWRCWHLLMMLFPPLWCTIHFDV